MVTTHHNPDADAIASVLTMAMYLKSLGKKPQVFNEDACPQWLRFLPGSSSFKKIGGTKKFDYDAAIVLDCADLKRVGGVIDYIQDSKPLVNIDHHVTNEGFGTINVVVPTASSTCEMLFNFFENAGYPLNKDLAVLLYAGIMTDTGSFRYDNTSAHSHKVAARLMAFKFSAAEMYRRLYVGIPVADMKNFTDLIHRARLLDNNRVYCVTLTKADKDRFSSSFDLNEKIFAFLRSTEGIEVVVILTELKPGEVRVNLRSQNCFDVASLAKQFEGGGHIKAAGCKINGSLASAQKIICSAIHQRI